MLSHNICKLGHIYISPVSTEYLKKEKSLGVEQILKFASTRI